MTHKKWYVIERAINIFALMFGMTTHMFLRGGRKTTVISLLAIAIFLLILDYVANILMTMKLKKSGKHVPKSSQKYNFWTLKGGLWTVIGLAGLCFTFYTMGDDIGFELRILGLVTFVAVMIFDSYIEYKKRFCSHLDNTAKTGRKA